MKHYFFAIALLITVLPVQAAPLPEGILNIMNQERYAHATWGLYAKDTLTGEVLYDLNATKFFLPASTTKLFSVSVFLDAYGADYRFKTPIYIVDGNLVLVGQGDLTFGGRQSDPDTISFTKMDHIIADSVPGTILTPQDPLAGLKNLAAQIKAKGIKEINGEVLIDDRLFETTVKRGMTLSPVILNENLIDFVFNPTSIGELAHMQVRPEVTGYTFQNHVQTVAQKEKGIGRGITITADETGRNIVAEGMIAADEKDAVYAFHVRDPKFFVRSALIDALKNEGITVNLPRDKMLRLLPESYDGLQPIAIYTSPPLSEYAKLILKVSHNLGADLVPLLLSAKAGKKTFDEGMLLFGEFVTEKVKLSKENFVFLDAAGGDSNRLTPEAEIHLLEYARNKPQFQKFYDALPILAVDGSLEDFGRNTRVVGKARAKPGTGVTFNAATGELFLTTQAFAGYIEGKDGHLIEFMLVVNNSRLPLIDDVPAIFEDLAGITARIYDDS